MTNWLYCKYSPQTQSAAPPIKARCCGFSIVAFSFPFSVFTFPFANAKVWQEKGDRKKTRLTQVYVNLYQPVSTSKPFLEEISLRKSWFCWPWTERWYCYHPCNCELPSNHLSGTSLMPHLQAFRHIYFSPLACTGGIQHPRRYSVTALQWKNALLAEGGLKRWEKFLLYIYIYYLLYLYYIILI